MNQPGPLYTRERRRCVAPDDRPGTWQDGPTPSADAMREAVRMATGTDATDLPWEAIRRLWEGPKGLKAQGWKIRTEKDWA